jgi:hypothetical protein
MLGGIIMDYFNKRLSIHPVLRLKPLSGPYKAMIIVELRAAEPTLTRVGVESILKIMCGLELIGIISQISHRR